MSLQKFIAFAKVSRFEKTVEPGTTYFDVAGISDKIVHDGPRETDFRLNYNQDSQGVNIVVHDVHAPFGEGKFAAELTRESKRLTKLFRRIAWEEILALPPYPEGMFIPDETISPKQILASRFAKGELLRFGGGNGPTWLKERDEWVDEPLVSGSIYSIFHAEDSGGRFGDIEKTRYVTPESDILSKEYQKRVIFQLAKEGLSVGIKLIDVCDSGKKSIHPTFRITKGDFQKDEEKPIAKETVERFIARCEQLGADSATLHPNAVARVPNALRQVIPDFVDPSTLPPGTSKCKKQTLLFWRPEGFTGQAIDLPLMEQMVLDADLDDSDEVDEVILPADGTGECPAPENNGEQARVERCRVPTDSSDIALSNLLHAHLKDDLIYIPELKDWSTWSEEEHRWILNSNSQLERIRVLLEAEHARAVEFQHRATGKSQQKAANDRKAQIEKWRNLKNVRAGLEFLAARLRVPLSELNTHRHLIVCPNGVLNLQTGSIEPTDRKKYLTERIPTPFLPEATCPRIDELVRWIANYDPAIEKFFWRWMAYCLTGDMSLHKSLFLKGCGRNKKTTLWLVFSKVMGELAVTIAPETLVRTRDRRGATPYLMPMLTARAVLTPEIVEGMELDEGIFKSLTGGEEIPCRDLFKGSFRFRSRAKLWLVGNALPQIRGTDHGMWSRVLMHEVKGVVKDEDRIPGYEDLLDAEIPGMLARMVREAKAFYDSDRSWEGIIPESMIQATEEYRQDEDPNEDFGLVLVEDPELRMSSTEAYRALCDHDEYYRRLGQKAVTRRLKDRYREYLLPVKGRNVFEGVGTLGADKARTARPLGIGPGPRQPICEPGFSLNGSKF